MADKKDKTDWSAVEGMLGKTEPSQAEKEPSRAVVSTPSQPLGLSRGLSWTPGTTPRGIIADFQENRLHKRAALEAMKLWYKGQLEVMEHSVTEAVRVGKAGASKDAERLLAMIDTEHLNCLTVFGLKNERIRMQALRELGDQTAQTIKEILDRDWPESMITRTVRGIKDRYDKFFDRIMEDLDSEQKP